MKRSRAGPFTREVKLLTRRRKANVAPRVRGVILYHRTHYKAARAILANGFKDGVGTYLTRHTHRGVWLSNTPLDINEGASGDTVLEVRLNIRRAEINAYEWKEEGKGYREFLVPARVVNAHMAVRIIDFDGLPVRAMASLCQIPRSRVYKLVRTGVWPAVRVGRRIRIPEEVLKALMNRPIAGEPTTGPTP